MTLEQGLHVNQFGNRTQHLAGTHPEEALNDGVAPVEAKRAARLRCGSILETIEDAAPKFVALFFGLADVAAELSILAKGEERGQVRRLELFEFHFAIESAQDFLDLFELLVDRLLN